jgi:DNA (cytosine-5)-methyltransferase 1
MTAWYNEIDDYAADWLENLIAAGHIAPGVVDRRSIAEVRPDDLGDFTQCHFFVGIGGWSLALRLAGWPDDRPVWTGSCPCQPFSAAGKRKGVEDERHLWPEFRRLIAERAPPVVFGEQVASKDGRQWLAGVRADLEALGYAVGAADLCAAGVGAPHIRQRLWWVADSDGGLAGNRGLQPGRQHGQQPEDGGTGRMAFPEDEQPHRSGDARGRRGEPSDRGGMGDASRKGLSERGGDGRVQRQALVASPWETSLGTGWLGCTDGKARRVEPGTFPLAHGVPNRVGRLRAYGNAIVPQVAARFVEAVVSAYEECRKK